MEGKFQLVGGDDDIMDKILEANGFSAELRSLNRTVKPIVGFVKNGDNYTLTMSGGGRDMSVDVTLGQEVTHTAVDGRTAKSVFTRDPARGLVQNEVIDGKTTTYARLVSGDELHVTVTHGDLVAKRLYKRV